MRGRNELGAGYITAVSAIECFVFLGFVLQKFDQIFLRKMHTARNRDLLLTAAHGE